MALDRMLAPRGAGREADSSGVTAWTPGSDEALMALVREGNDSAFTELLARYHQPLTAYLTTMLRDRSDADDAAQETFLRVHGRAALYEPRFPFRSWLYRIATNVAIDAVRRRRRWRFTDVSDALVEWRARRAPGPPPENLAAHAGQLDGLVQEELGEAVRAAIATLPPRYRAVLALRELEELSYEEVAQTLDCTLGTVKSRVNRARNMLRDKLAAKWNLPSGQLPCGQPSSGRPPANSHAADAPESP